MRIPHQQLSGRLHELPRERTIVTIYDSGIRSFESQALLTSRGFPHAFAMEGGLNLLKHLGVDLLAEVACA